MMPKQGQSVESCIISQWFKKKGDSVKAGDLLFSYETDKASFEEEAKADGVLLEIFFNEGDEVPVLVNVAVIGVPGESVAEFSPNGATPAATPVEELPAVTTSAKVTVAQTSPSAPASAGTKIRVSPRARVMAEKKGLDLSRVSGTGPNGRIIVRDIEALEGQTAPVRQAVADAQVAAVPTQSTVDRTSEQNTTGFEIKKLTNIRKLIAKAMHESLQNSAQLTHHLSADVRKLLALREETKKAQKNNPDYPNITLNDMICWAVIRALEKNPDVNAQYLGEGIKVFKQVHLGLAVDTPRGLMVPVLKNANDLSLKGLSNNLRLLADGCRKGGITPELLQSEAGSFTVSNLGNYGVEIFTPIINVPQVAILGVNTIVHRPADVGGGVMGFVPYIGLSLTYDHRAIDGGPATLFLKEIKTQIENFQAVV
jgi:pyruvate dehydrogenase E2 component (dihydrolipoamide acetyltransferase)